MKIVRGEQKATKHVLVLVLALHASAALAQKSAADDEAKKIFAELISFRTSVGHGQVSPMAAAILERLADAGVPPTDIAQLPQGETLA